MYVYVWYIIALSKSIMLSTPLAMYYTLIKCYIFPVLFYLMHAKAEKCLSSFGKCIHMYHIRSLFGGNFNLVIWQILCESPNLSHTILKTIF